MLFKIHFNIINSYIYIQVFQVVCFFQAFPSKPCLYISSPQYMSSAVPILSFLIWLPKYFSSLEVLTLFIMLFCPVSSYLPILGLCVFSALYSGTPLAHDVPLMWDTKFHADIKYKTRQNYSSEFFNLYILR